MNHLVRKFCIGLHGLDNYRAYGEALWEQIPDCNDVRPFIVLLSGLDRATVDMLIQQGDDIWNLRIPEQAHS